MCLRSLQTPGARVMRRRSFMALLTGVVLGAALPRRIVAGDLQTANRTGLITLNDYEFIPPDGWVVKRNTDHFLMQNPQSGCLIQIFEPRTMPADLEQISRALFKKTFAGWQFRQTGGRQYLLSTGVLPKGLEFFMTEAEMSKDGGEFGGLQDGAALIVKAGPQVIIIGARHPSNMFDHRRCVVTYATWRRFFNSFSVRNTPIVREAEGELSRRIVGRWTLIARLAVGELVFAADGTYAPDGAFGSSAAGVVSSRSREGRYSMAGDQLIMIRPGGTAEQMRFRFERVNHGGTGWRDRLYLLKKDAFGENEVSYEKR